MPFLSYFVLDFGIVVDKTKGREHAREVVYHWAMPPSGFLLFAIHYIVEAM